MPAKRTAAALCVIPLFISLCFAQEASTPAETITGKVVSVSSGFAGMSFASFGKAKKPGKEKNKKNKGKNPTIITITDEKGEDQKFAVKPETLITDKNDKKVELKAIERGDTVTIAYTTNAKKHTYDAVSVKVVKFANRLLKIFDNVSFGAAKP